MALNHIPKWLTSPGSCHPEIFKCPTLGTETKHSNFTEIAEVKEKH